MCTISLVPIYLEIFLIGLLGGMHCIGMCGGFVALYSLRDRGGRSSLPEHVLYNFGRITTYSLLGGVMGWIGSFSAYLSSYKGIPGAVLLLAGAVVVLMGLNMLGVGGKRGLLEYDVVTSLPVFRRTVRALLHSRTPWGVFLFGALLGLLPCGLLYPVLMHAAVSGRFYSGFLSLAVFGLGTVPVLMAFGTVISRIQQHLRLALYRLAAGLIVLLGIQTLLRGFVFLGWMPAGRFW